MTWYSERLVWDKSPAEFGSANYASMGMWRDCLRRIPLIGFFLASAWAMARRRPKEYLREVGAATRCSGVSSHSWPNIIYQNNADIVWISVFIADVCSYSLKAGWIHNKLRTLSTYLHELKIFSTLLHESFESWSLHLLKVNSCQKSWNPTVYVNIGPCSHGAVLSNNKIIS